MPFAKATWPPANSTAFDKDSFDMRTEYSQSIIPVKSQSSLTPYSYGSNFLYMKFGDRLKLAREHAALTQEELAVKAQVKQGTISKIERGDAESSTFTVQLAVACGVRPEWLAMESGEMIDGGYLVDMKTKAVLTAMQNLPEYKKDILVQTSNALAEQPKQENNGTK